MPYLIVYLISEKFLFQQCFVFAFDISVTFCQAARNQAIRLEINSIDDDLWAKVLQIKDVP